MNAGKTTTLLQSAYNYRERGMKTLVFKPKVDDRYNPDRVRSRIGLESDAASFESEDDLLAPTEEIDKKTPLSCVLLDEAQFLTKTQVYALGEIDTNAHIDRNHLYLIFSQVVGFEWNLNKNFPLNLNILEDLVFFRIHI